jgi:hypothetical protein
MAVDEKDFGSSEQGRRSDELGSKAKKPVPKSVWALVALVVVLVGCMGAVAKTAVPSIDTTANVATAPAQSSASVTPQAPTAHVGSTVSVKDQSGSSMDVTLVKVVDPATGASGLQPDSGKRFVGVQFKITNAGTTSLSDDPDLDVVAYDGTSQSYNITLYPLVDCPAITSSMKLSPGSSAMGCETFELPVGANLSKFQFTPSAATSGSTGEWVIP